MDGAPSLFTKILRSPQEQHFAGVFVNECAEALRRAISTIGRHAC